MLSAACVGAGALATFFSLFMYIITEPPTR